jgi:hypothetical protein
MLLVRNQVNSKVFATSKFELFVGNQVRFCYDGNFDCGTIDGITHKFFTLKEYEDCKFYYASVDSDDFQHIGIEVIS